MPDESKWSDKQLAVELENIGDVDAASLDTMHEAARRLRTTDSRIQAAVEAEREACAQACEYFMCWAESEADRRQNAGLTWAARRIRGRSAPPKEKTPDER